MEKKLKEYRQKQASTKPAVSPQSCIRPLQNNSRKTSSFVTILKKIEAYVVQSRLFLFASNALVDLPVIGNIFILKLILWLILFGLAVEVEFAMVYCVLSALLFIYLNTSTEKRNKNQKSAYSVFNENCERLQGTFTAEQFDKQLRHGNLIR